MEDCKIALFLCLSVVAACAVGCATACAAACASFCASARASTFASDTYKVCHIPKKLKDTVISSIAEGGTNVLWPTRKASYGFML
jgi:ABC-type sugar transport system substrate-binding protein